jgi:hypothetical protein
MPKMMMFVMLLCLTVSAMPAGLKRKLPTAGKISIKTKASSSSSGATSSSSSSTATSSSSNIPSQHDVLKKTWLMNKLSAKDVNEIALAGYNEGADSVRNFARAGNWGKAGKNLARDMLRNIMKTITLPEIFWWPIPVWDPDERIMITKPHPFLLPHEMFHHIVSKDQTWLPIDGAVYPEIFEMLKELCREHHMDMAATTGIGIHGDGVPYTKKHSIEILSWNFLSSPTADRIPITAISKQFVCKCGCKGNHTWNAVFQVLAWSLRMLFMGCVANILPDGSKMLEGFNRLASGTRLVGHAFLLQARGDWPFLKQLFSFPAYNEVRGLCWKCLATLRDCPLSFKKTGLNAEWRAKRLTDAQFLDTLRASGIPINPLLSLPGFLLRCVVLDWLHVVDLGVSADLLGNLFFEVTMTTKGVCPGPNKDVRLDLLWAKLQAWYKEVKPPSRLDNLTHEMIKGSDHAKPKLRSKGGECRYLLPFGAELAAEVADHNPSMHNVTVATLFSKLVLLQKYISGSIAPYNSEVCCELCRQVCVLYNALHEEMVANGTPHLWDMKPKVHLLQELVEYQAIELGNPRYFWCYRDESWCGFWAKASKRRGGANSSNMTAERFLSRYRAMNGDPVTCADTGR